MTANSRIDRLERSGRPWLTDGGLETSMVFHEGLDLPLFASLFLLESDAGREAMARYFERFVDLAKEAGTGFVLDTATWRSGLAWAKALERDVAAMEACNREAVSFAQALRARHETVTTPIAINGVVGPAGDGYAPEALLAPGEAQRMHATQVGWLVKAGVDVISAITMTHPGEAIGITRAAADVGAPVVVSFTLETDGRLPNGQTLAEAIAETDAATDEGPIYYMINCAHPDHFSDVLDGPWLSRIGGVRANASRLSHAELDAAETLDEGDPEEFGLLHRALKTRLPALRVVGGCCGTDDRHVGCLARHVVHGQSSAA